MIRLRCSVRYAGSNSVSLAAELDLLLHLLAVSPHLSCPHTAPGHQGGFLPTGAAASLYAGQVLTLAGQFHTPPGQAQQHPVPHVV